MSSEWLKPSLCLSFCLSLPLYFSPTGVLLSFNTLICVPVTQAELQIASVLSGGPSLFLSLSPLLSSWHFPVACEFWQLNMSKALYQTSKVKVMQYKTSRRLNSSKTFHLLGCTLQAKLLTLWLSSNGSFFFPLYWDLSAFRFTKMSISYCHVQGHCERPISF